MTEVQAERIATGGEAVARLDDGRVVFVRGALPGERVRIERTEEKKRFARANVIEVIEPSPHRREPSCSHAQSQECGGCDWMHVAANTQVEFKRGIVVEQLERLGHVESPHVTVVDSPTGQRTTVRCSVLNGEAGYRTRRSADIFAATECSAAHPLLEELIVSGHFADATEVTLRVSAATGHRLVLTDGDPTQVQAPDGVVVVSASDPGSASIIETVAGLPWRISAGSFFQTSPQGAEDLVAAVQAGVGDSDGELVDLYSGVGLLGGAAAPDQLTCSVESNPSSVADAKHNLGDTVDVQSARVEHWKPRTFATVIADPARRGLSKDGVRAVEATNAARLVLVSCDPASLGRDTALLREQGWRYDHGKVIDMFPNTSQVEVVSTFSR